MEFLYFLLIGAISGWLAGQLCHNVEFEIPVVFISLKSMQKRHN